MPNRPLRRHAGLAAAALAALATACSPGATKPGTAAPTTSAPQTPSPPPPPDNTFVIVGRPLRQRRRLLSPSVARGGDVAVHPDAERLAALREAPALAALWLGAARMEHASVPAFAEVALLLTALGAPLDLVEAAHRAALDEVEHTRLSYALANAYGATAHTPGALPRLLGRRAGSRLRGTRAALRRVSVEALRDGCMNEGYAAGLARAGAAGAKDPAPRDALAAIAADEAAHAELSWRVLGWCLSAGDVRGAVARALRGLPAAGPAPTRAVHLAAHGWPTPEEAAAVYAGVREDVVRRAAGLLDLAG